MFNNKSKGRNAGNSVAEIRARLFGGAPVSQAPEAGSNLFGAGNPDQQAEQEAQRRAQNFRDMRSFTVEAEDEGESVDLSQSPLVNHLRSSILSNPDGRPPEQVKIVRKETRYSEAEMAELDAGKDK